MSEEGEWAEDDYLQSLVDAWDLETQLQYTSAKAEDEDAVVDPEVEEIYKEIKRFNDELDEKLKNQKIGLVKEHQQLSEKELELLVLDALLERDASIEWLRTYKDTQILYGVMDRETMTRIYDTSKEVADIPTPLYRIYIEALTPTAILPKELKS